MSTTRVARRIGSTLITAATVVATIIVVLMLVPGLLGMQRYVITGGSMSGTFERGALVLEREVPIADLRVGDVITYLPPKESGLTELVTHRIHTITNDPSAPGGRVFQTQGDANEGADPWTFTLPAATQPRVVGWVPTVGWAFIALSMPIVRMLLIGIPSAVIAVMFLRDLVQAMRVGSRRGPDGTASTEPANTTGAIAAP